MSNIAVIYARYSSDNQREESIEGQVRECTAFAELKGYSVLKVYADRAISGTRADNRPEFQQMISDSAKGEFDSIIVWKIDRFSRDKYDSVIYKAKLNKNGVNVISATEPIDDTPEGKLMESIFEGFSEYYVKDLELKISRGMTENVIKGKFNGGNITFGYMLDSERHFEKDPATAPIVEDIFKRYANGETIRSIVNDLNSRGIRNRGRKLTYHFMNCLLKNRRYLGEYSFRGTINKNAFPPIVTEALFEKCQLRMVANKHKAASFKTVNEKFLLTGKLYCGHCGERMSGVSGKGKYHNIYRYYQCMNSKKKICNKKPVPKNYIENIVLKATISIFDDKQLMERICQSCFDLQSKESTVLPALKKRHKENQKELENIMKAIKAGLITKTTKSTLEQLEKEQEQPELEIALENMNHTVISKDKIKTWIIRFAKTDITKTDQKQKLIDIFVNSIYVYDDKLVILLNYKDGGECITLTELNNSIKKENTHKNECSSSFEFGGAEGNRTPVRKPVLTTFSECSLSFKIPAQRRRQTGCADWYP